MWSACLQRRGGAAAQSHTRGCGTVPFMYVGIEKDLLSAHCGAPRVKLRTSRSESGELANKLQTQSLGIRMDLIPLYPLQSHVL